MSTENPTPLELIEKAKAESTEPPPTVEPIDEKIVSEKQSCLNKAIAILRAHDNKEGNIPYQSDYWKLMNRYRTL